MAGDWMKIELELPDKPEVHAIASKLNLDPDAIVGKLIRIWQWFDKHTTNGNAIGVTCALPDRISGVTGFGSAMMFVGWLEQNDTGLTMPKFDRHTSNSAKTRALTGKRVSKLRNGDSVTKTLPEKRREEKILKPLTPTELLSLLGVPDQVAKDWMKVRKAKRAPLTETALDDLKREAEKAGITPVEAITICAKKNWQGFNAGWNWKDEQLKRGMQPPENFSQRDYGTGVQDL